MKKTPAQFKKDRHDKTVQGVASQGTHFVIYNVMAKNDKVHKLKKQMTKIKVIIMHILML